MFRFSDPPQFQKYGFLPLGEKDTQIDYFRDDKLETSAGNVTSFPHPKRSIKKLHNC